MRLKNRHGHEVLNGKDESSKLVYLSFLKLFQNFEFEKKINSNPEFSKNVFLQKINFTDEDKNIKADEDTEKFFDMDNIKKYSEKYINEYFKKIEEIYDGKNFFADTRELIKTEVQDLLENGIKSDSK